MLDYHNLKGRVYLTMDRNEEALTHLLPWLSGILQLRPDGTKKTQRRLARLGYACYTVGSAKAAILLQKKDAGENIRQEDFAEAMRYLEKAVKTEQEEGQVVSYYHTIADIWRQCQEYGKVVDVCDKMLRLNPGIIRRYFSGRKPASFSGCIRKWQMITREQCICILFTGVHMPLS